MAEREAQKQTKKRNGVSVKPSGVLFKTTEDKNSNNHETAAMCVIMCATVISENVLV